MGSVVTDGTDVAAMLRNLADQGEKLQRETDEAMRQVSELLPPLDAQQLTSEINAAIASAGSHEQNMDAIKRDLPAKTIPWAAANFAT